LHSYRALVRWWLSFLVHRLSLDPRWRFALRAGSSPTSPSGSPNKRAPAVGWQSSLHGALPQHVPRLVTFASARQYNDVLSRRPASASSRRYDRARSGPMLRNGTCVTSTLLVLMHRRDAAWLGHASGAFTRSVCAHSEDDALTGGSEQFLARLCQLVTLRPPPASSDQQSKSL
jgi:hypothetical protein